MQRQYRLRNNEDFNRVFRFGKSSANRQFVVYVLRNPKTEHFRVGISASKKLGSAVVRNRLRRVVKEIMRHHVGEIAPHHDLVIILRKPVAEMDFHAIEKSLLHVLRRASLIQKNV